MDRELIALRLGQGGIRSNMTAALAEALTTDKTVKLPATTGTINLDSQDADCFMVGPLTGNVTLNIPRQAPLGREINLVIELGATAYTVTWGSMFRKQADGATSASKKGATSFVWDGTHWVQRGGALAWV